MIELDDFILDNSYINIAPLLSEMDLPIRLLNILRKRHFHSEESFYNNVEQLILQYTSRYLFPNQLVSFYPQVKEKKANRNLECHLSGASIKRGSFYYTYHPFIENLETGKVYVIKKKICAELAYIDYFPQDLFTYEEWYYRMHNAYYENDNSIVDFYLLSRECGESCLDLYPLAQRKSRRKK